MSVKKRLFWLLWAMGMAGVLSFLLVDRSGLKFLGKKENGRPDRGRKAGGAR